MARFIIVTFGFLAFAFYEMSGGSDFDAEETRLSRIDAPAVVEEEALDSEPVVVANAPEPVLPENVTRVALNLNSVNDVLRPQRTVRTTAARVRAAEPEVTEVALSEEEPTLILPSLIVDTAVITPVDFGAPAPEAPVASGRDIRAVSARSVNVRGGPGTDYSVVNRLTRGAEVEVLQDPGNGWVKLRPVDGGTIGWMADFLLNKG
ncbi:SH3 domain-containing protein [uncultured Tateyamaria sp.]|uniref:SH3 domain-containing protein n=1 Tax=uncultured Tateyamaria sp. TaxID=455651 RepID=UPI002630D223|nr:SH3 domain-containing protein [uncultured Tateyamaria sp.]